MLDNFILAIINFTYFAVLPIIQPSDNNQMDMEDEKFEEIQISYKQWISTDRCELTSCVLPLQEFLVKCCEKLEQL